MAVVGATPAIQASKMTGAYDRVGTVDEIQAAIVLIVAATLAIFRYKINVIHVILVSRIAEMAI